MKRLFREKMEDRNFQTKVKELFNKLDEIIELLKLLTNQKGDMGEVIEINSSTGTCPICGSTNVTIETLVTTAGPKDVYECQQCHHKWANEA